MKYNAHFMLPTEVGNTDTPKSPGQKTYRSLTDFWKAKGCPIPGIHELVRYLTSIIVVKDSGDKIVGTAFVHKSKVVENRMKMLDNLQIPAGPEGLAVLREIVALFAKQGRKFRRAFIYDDLEAGEKNRMKIYKEAGFSPAQVLMMR